LTVNLIAFSGATPTNWGIKPKFCILISFPCLYYFNSPRYKPETPSYRITFLKQSIEFR
jgi:hypothetical protein